MSQESAACHDIEPLIRATAMGEAIPAESARVEDHIEGCVLCRIVLEQYQNVNALVAKTRLRTMRTPGLGVVRWVLQRRLTDFRRRLISYGLFPSPLGPLLIARSEEGVSLIKFLPQRNVDASYLSRFRKMELVERSQDVKPFYQELLEYLEGRRMDLNWPLDWRLTRSKFQRKVLQVTASLPYGAAASYVGIAREIGKPRAVRAVAQALSWNPLPLAVPCHRVIGTSGFLSGYVGGKIRLKRLLLATEGVQFVKSRRGFKINAGVMYACAPGDHTYCLPTCRSLRRVRPGRATLFASRNTAEAAGLSPCTTCRPDLYSCDSQLASH